mmetsp:Transcript_47694/g.94114  ORF Transcript_47694/g.94114 Transcript_47694/m.94114 type:complete len:93 (+) Transcript_47694:687-965(+)
MVSHHATQERGGSERRGSFFLLNLFGVRKEGSSLKRRETNSDKEKSTVGLSPSSFFILIECLFVNTRFGHCDVEIGPFPFVDLICRHSISGR